MAGTNTDRVTVPTTLDRAALEAEQGDLEQALLVQRGHIGELRQALMQAERRELQILGALEHNGNLLARLRET